MIQIGYLDLSGLEKEVYERLYHLASPQRRQRADRYRFQEDSRRCIAADGLLRYAARHTLGTDRLELAKTAEGKPFLPGRCDFQFNLSHSGRWVVIAWGNSPLGIDVEMIRMDEGKEQLARRFFCSDEQDWLFSAQGHDRALRFFEIWTKKESYLKYLGTGINRPLNSFSVFRLPEVAFCTHFPEDAVLTLCSKSTECQILPVTPEMLFSE